jgi:hypothetical protein
MQALIVVGEQVTGPYAGIGQELPEKRTRGVTLTICRRGHGHVAGEGCE